MQKESFYIQRNLNSKKEDLLLEFELNRKKSQKKIYKEQNLSILVSFWVDVVHCMCKYYVRYTLWDNEKKKLFET